MIPELYRSYETSTLKGLVSYGDPVDEELATEGWGRRDEESTPLLRARSHRRRFRSSLRRKNGKWLRLGQRPITRTQLR
jgi:hypothetical protein